MDADKQLFFVPVSEAGRTTYKVVHETGATLGVVEGGAYGMILFSPEKETSYNVNVLMEVVAFIYTLEASLRDSTY